MAAMGEEKEAVEDAWIRPSVSIYRLGSREGRQIKRSFAATSGVWLMA